MIIPFIFLTNQVRMDHILIISMVMVTEDNNFESIMDLAYVLYKKNRIDHPSVLHMLQLYTSSLAITGVFRESSL